jgi:hypothetical protein
MESTVDEVNEGGGGTASLAYIHQPAFALFFRKSFESPTLKSGIASAAPAEAFTAM